MRREDNPRWRLILQERWRDQLQQVTELSRAKTRHCADCVAAVGVTTDGTVAGPLADRVPAPRVPAGAP